MIDLIKLIVKDNFLSTKHAKIVFWKGERAFLLSRNTIANFCPNWHGGANVLFCGYVGNHLKK